MPPLLALLSLSELALPSQPTLAGSVAASLSPPPPSVSFLRLLFWLEFVRPQRASLPLVPPCRMHVFALPHLA